MICPNSVVTENRQFPSMSKGRKLLINDNIYLPFKELNILVYAETLLNYPDFMTTFALNTDASDKHSGAVISQNNKPIVFFYRRLKDLQHNYTTTEK